MIDMRRFSGLRRVLPITHATFLCGAAALAGIPIFAGFWSKDEIVDSSLIASHATAIWRPVFRAVRPCLAHGGADRVLHVPRLLPHILGRSQSAAGSRRASSRRARCPRSRRRTSQRSPEAMLRARRAVRTSAPGDDYSPDHSGDRRRDGRRRAGADALDQPFPGTHAGSTKYLPPCRTKDSTGC